MSKLVECLERADGSEVLRTVMLGQYRADVLCVRAADEIERLRAAVKFAFESMRDGADSDAFAALVKAAAETESEEP